MHKITIIALALLLIGSIASTIQSASGATTLSAPEFTIKLVAYPYEIPIYTVNQSTGETVAQQGYYMENRSIEVKIKNPTTQKEYPLYFDVQMKDPSWQSWHTAIETSGYGHYSTDPPYSSYLASVGEYTVISCYANYTVGSKLDFQVKAYYGKTTWYDTPGYPLRSYSTFEVIASSLWSPTQTITLETPEIHVATPTSSETPAPTVTQTPTEASAQPTTQTGILLGINLEQTIIAILCITGAGLTVTLAFSRKHLKNKGV